MSGARNEETPQATDDARHRRKQLDRKRKWLRDCSWGKIGKKRRGENADDRRG